VRFTISRRGRRAPSYGITTADGSHLDDIARRQKQYAATMAFRVVAIIVVVVVPGLSVMERVILGLVATIIPYVAVIRANGGPDTSEPTNMMIGGPQQYELPPVDRALGGRQRVDGDAWDDGAEHGAAGHDRDEAWDDDGDDDEDGERDGEDAETAAT
jgi:hypothetical protein